MIKNFKLSPTFCILWRLNVGAAVVVLNVAGIDVAEVREE